MTELLLQRSSLVGEALTGTLAVDGRVTYFTMERLAVAIPAGRYRVVMSVSGRAQRGTLWSPDLVEHRLPELLDVPGRTAIRIHALNDPGESAGCIGIGMTHSPGHIGMSRVAVQELMKHVWGQLTWITVCDIPTGGTV